MNKERHHVIQKVCLHQMANWKLVIVYIYYVVSNVDTWGYVKIEAQKDMMMTPGFNSTADREMSYRRLVRGQSQNQRRWQKTADGKEQWERPDSIRKDSGSVWKEGKMLCFYSNSSCVLVVIAVLKIHSPVYLSLVDIIANVEIIKITIHSISSFSWKTLCKPRTLTFSPLGLCCSHLFLGSFFWTGGFCLVILPIAARGVSTQVGPEDNLELQRISRLQRSVPPEKMAAL